MLNASGLILLGSHIELEVAHLFIACFLQLTEFKNQVLVRLRFLTQVRLQLVDAALQVVLAVAQVVDAALVDVNEVVLGHLEFFGLAVLQILDLVGVLVFKLRFDVIVGIQDSVHVLFSLLFGVKEALFESVDLVIHALDLVFEICVLAVEEGFVLLQQVDLAAEAFIASFDFVLGLLKLRKLKLKFF